MLLLTLTYVVLRFSSAMCSPVLHLPILRFNRP